jgi:ribosomal protein S18 acetylase RimI-like enzyme
MTATVRLATEADSNSMCASLAQAFEDDPVMVFLFPREAGRVEKLRRFFLLLSRVQHFPHGGCYTTEDQVGAALWDPPGKWKMPTTSILRAGPSLISILGARVVTGLRALGEIEKLHPPQPHWYLAVLGTAPDHQGKGIGSALLAPVLDRCDREGLPSYLESSKESNVPFYRRHGYEVTREIRLPGGPPVWAMWREPQPPE